MPVLPPTSGLPGDLALLVDGIAHAMSVEDLTLLQFSTALPCRLLAQGDELPGGPRLLRAADVAQLRGAAACMIGREATRHLLAINMPVKVPSGYWGWLNDQGAFGTVRCVHPLLATASGTGEVLGVRQRGGNANSGREAASFLTEVFGRVRAAGATGQLSLRAGSGFYSHKVVSTCKKAEVRFSVTAKMSPSLRKAVEEVPEEGWSPIPYWTEGGANAAWLAIGAITHNLARWCAKLGKVPGSTGPLTLSTLRRRYIAVPGHLSRSARRTTLHLAKGWPWAEAALAALRALRALAPQLA